MAEEEKSKTEEVKETNHEPKGKCAICNHKKGPLVIIVGVAVIIILGAGAFSVLHLKGERLGKRGLFNNELGGPGMRGYGHMGQNGPGGRGGQFSQNGASKNATSGKVTAVNDKKFTVDVSGTSKDIQISDTTRFPLNSATSVKVGDTVIVRGQQDSSGVIQATTVLVNPQTTQ